MNVRVGVGVIVYYENKIFLLKRQGSHGSGEWSFPGGHLEYFETLEDCACREVKEELDIEIENLKFLTITNDIFEKENKHYITIYFTSDYKSGDYKIMEPDKATDIGLFDKNELPEPLFLPIRNLLENEKKLNYKYL